MKPWQRGHSLAKLKEIAGFFREHLGEYTHGAFGLPKERDVAAALSTNSLATFRTTQGKLLAAALVKRLARGSVRSDFRGEALEVSGPAVLVHALAGRPASVSTLLQKIDPLRVGFYLLLHEENAALKEEIERFRFAWVGTQVSAGSDVLGLYRKNAEAEKLPPEEEASLCPLALSPVDEGAMPWISEEVGAWEKWEQHYSSYNKRKSWTAFSLFGFDKKDPGFIIKPSEMSKAWKAANQDRVEAVCTATSAARHFPNTLKLVGRLFPQGFERVRFMRLRGKDGELARHADITDREAGTRDGALMRIHLPIQTSPGCTFTSWSARGQRIDLHLEAGRLFYLDTRKPHAVANAGADDRIHLVVDAAASPALRKAVVNGMVAGPDSR